jgi:hypothetical protein
VLAVWLVEHLDLPDAVWHRLAARWAEAARAVPADGSPVPDWIRALVAQAPALAHAALQPWPHLRLTLDPLSVGEVRLTLTHLFAGAAAQPPLVEATVPSDLAAAFWAPTAVTGWAGVLVGQRHSHASAFFPTLFLGTSFVVRDRGGAV